MWKYFYWKMSLFKTEVQKLPKTICFPKTGSLFVALIQLRLKQTNETNYS